MMKKKRKLIDQIATLIAEGVEINGDIRVSGGIQIDGKINGSVISDDKDAIIRVSHTGSIRGEIRAPNIILNGNVEGNVYCGTHLELSERAVVSGDLHYSVIEMLVGAQVNGKMIHDAGHTLTEDQPSSDAVVPVALKTVSESWDADSTNTKTG
jgi:cytoskeletal protein CcmA (bactofilin family)